MTGPLLALGHEVTAVDRSELLLAHAPEQATRVLADIETLQLDRRFPVVLLASNLVNVSDREARRQLLRSCRRHLERDGAVVLQRYAPSFDGWDDRAWRRRGSIELRIAAAERDGDEFTATVEYRSGARRWSHSFTAVLLDDADLQLDAAAADLLVASALTADRSWIELRPLPTCT